MQNFGDVDLRWLWDSGIAEQGVLRDYLQPSVFGVFLLLSLSFALKRNHVRAVVALIPAASIHANYLFLSAILTIIYLFWTNFERKTLVASLALFLCTIPYAIHIGRNFVFLDEVTTNEINNAVLAGYEDNIHINPQNWLNPKFYLQLTLVAYALVITRNGYLGQLMWTIILAMVTITAFAFFTDSTTLISLNPWRLSVILVPIAISVVIAKIVKNMNWEQLRPVVFGLIGGICLALIYYRLFGNDSEAFISPWRLFLTVAVIVSVIVLTGISQFEKRFRLIEWLVVIALISVGGTEMYLQQTYLEQSAQFKAIERVKASNDRNTVYIIPPEWTSLRMNANKPVFVDNNLVFGPILPGINERLSMVREAYRTGDFSELRSTVPDSVQLRVVENTGLTYKSS